MLRPAGALHTGRGVASRSSNVPAPPRRLGASATLSKANARSSAPAASPTTSTSPSRRRQASSLTTATAAPPRRGAQRRSCRGHLAILQPLVRQRHQRRLHLPGLRVAPRPEHGVQIVSGPAMATLVQSGIVRRPHRLRAVLERATHGGQVSQATSWCGRPVLPVEPRRRVVLPDLVGHACLLGADGHHRLGVMLSCSSNRQQHHVPPSEGEPLRGPKLHREERRHVQGHVSPALRAQGLRQEK